MSTEKIAGKEEVEPLPPYEVVAVTIPVSVAKFPIEAGTSVWVESKKEGQKAAESQWKEATYLEMKSSTKTRFEKGGRRRVSTNRYG